MTKPQGNLSGTLNGTTHFRRRTVDGTVMAGNVDVHLEGKVSKLRSCGTMYRPAMGSCEHDAELWVP
jgi:glyoxylate utilization-related uncharacterized protein